MAPEEISGSRDAFNAYVYTPWDHALTELANREGNADLVSYIQQLIPGGVPPLMQGKKSAVLFRHIATPNYEVHRFLVAADALEGLEPLILEYTKDKFTNRNEWKFSLAKLSFHKGHSKMNEMLVENKIIIDINESNFKPIHTLQTHWGQNLVDFHHEMLYEAFPQMQISVHDMSDWLQENGPTAKEYYKRFLALFLQHGILFENFMLEGEERAFTEQVILPAFIEIEKESGMKPLIVALEPTDIEGDRFWLSHPHERKQHFDRKIAEGPKPA